jgi:arabinogalactan oligomer/maltooligosaccharide transport system permease protein
VESRDRFQPYGFILPALIATAIITLLPTLYTVYLSFTNWSLYHFQRPEVVGLKNYREILVGGQLKVFLVVFAWTLAWSASSVFFSLCIGLFFAMLLNRKDLAGRNFYRTLLIVPWAMPSFITVLMWGGLLDSRFGAMNRFLALFQLGPVNWLTDPNWARFSVVMVNVWLTFPFMMSIILGALQSIPSDMYEAAAIDGASKPTVFWKMTVPSLRNAMIPVIITSFAFAFNNFIGIYLLTRGGPPLPGGGGAGATDILVSYTFKLGFDLQLYGLASAYAVVIFFLIGSLSLINSSLSGAFRED